VRRQNMPVAQPSRHSRRRRRCETAEHRAQRTTLVAVRLSGLFNRSYIAAGVRYGDRGVRHRDMDQATELRPASRRLAAERLRDFVVTSVDAAASSDTPFGHLELDRIFPDDIYAGMLANMPEAADYRPMHGRSRKLDLPDGTHTRVKMDLFPEFIRHLPPQKRGVWYVVGRALCSPEVRDAFVRRLRPGLEHRFGAGFAKVGMFPIPVLTRDIPGYQIAPHPDTRWKGITVQLYLPSDRAHTDIGTIFHEKLPDGSLKKTKQMPFAPNTGYAFAVGTDTWHSADRVGPEVKTRDSILLTYFVDAGPVRYLRNRGKRLGNFVVNELRNGLR
jgi:hypothetical protein